MRERFGFEVAVTGQDAGYFTQHICKGLIDRGIFGVIGYRRPNRRDGYFNKREYAYDNERDGYVCPNGEFLAYRTTNRLGYREYGSQAMRSLPGQGAVHQQSKWGEDRDSACLAALQGSPGYQPAERQGPPAVQAAQGNG